MVYGNLNETSNPRPEDPGSSCPTCGSKAGFIEREGSDDFGNYENWLECKANGCLTDDDELIRIRREITQ